jgi:hypothetical protein
MKGMKLDPQRRVNMAFVFAVLMCMALISNWVLARYGPGSSVLQMLPAEDYEVMDTTADQLALDRERTAKMYRGDTTVWDTQVRPFEKALGDGKQYVMVMPKGKARLSLGESRDMLVPLSLGLAVVVMLWPRRSAGNSGKLPAPIANPNVWRKE